MTPDQNGAYVTCEASVCDGSCRCHYVTDHSEPTERPRISVTGGDDDVMAHCGCGWYDTVPAGTAWGHFAWLVSQHAQTHRRPVAS